MLPDYQKDVCFQDHVIRGIRRHIIEESRDLIIPIGSLEQSLIFDSSIYLLNLYISNYITYKHSNTWISNLSNSSHISLHLKVENPPTAPRIILERELLYILMANNMKVAMLMGYMIVIL